MNKFQTIMFIIEIITIIVLGIVWIIIPNIYGKDKKKSTTYINYSYIQSRKYKNKSNKIILLI